MSTFNKATTLTQIIDHLLARYPDIKAVHYLQARDRLQFRVDCERGEVSHRFVLTQAIPTGSEKTPEPELYVWLAQAKEAMEKQWPVYVRMMEDGLAGKKEGKGW